MTAQSRPRVPVHAGFRTEIDQATARHQLRMSAGVVVVLALAILASAFAFRPERDVDLSARDTSWSAVAAGADAAVTTAQRS